MNNRAVHIDGKRTAFQPPREFGAHIASEGMFEGDISYRLKEAGENKTALEYDFRYRYETFFARLMEPLITPQAQKKLDGDLARLKQLAEQSN